MPITLSANKINIKNGGSYQNVGLLINTAFPYECTTPEEHGAVGDGVNDDTEALQSALTSGLPVIASKTYSVSSVNVKDTVLVIYGEIIGTVTINNNARVVGGKITQTTSDPCVVFESAVSGKGYMNSTLQDCTLVPNSNGVGIKLYANTNPLFGFHINNIDISSCEKAIYINSINWITKCAIENIFCHSSDYPIFIDNTNGSVAFCTDIVIKNVYAQYYNNKPINFFKLNTGNCRVTLYDSLCYDGIGEHHYNLIGNTGDTKITIQGMLMVAPSSATFVNTGNLSAFNFNTQYSSDSLYLKPSFLENLPTDKNGGLYFENFNSPALSSSRFFGFIGRGGTHQGASEPNKVFGVSCYDGRLSVLRSTDGTIGNGSVVEVATPYSGNVYTTATLPSSVRDGATCWCSDIKMQVTYYSGSWYKPDGTVLG